MSTNEPSSSRIITTRGELHDAMREAFARAAAEGCREIYWADVNFAEWPLGERAIIDHLTQWAYAHRRLTMLAHHYDDVIRRHPRFVDWRRQWGHIIECRACTEVEPEQFPSLFIAPGLFTLKVLDRVSHRAVLSSDTGDELRARELFDACLQRSTPSFAASITGL
jgi:hypothetical protein